MSKIKYYIKEGDQQFGPFSFYQMRRKQLTSETEVRYSGSFNWKRIEEFPQLKNIPSRNSLFSKITSFFAKA